MKRNQAYPSEWIRAESHLVENNQPARTMVLTIAGIASQTFDDGKHQRVLRFHEVEERLGLNVTNWDTIAKMTAQDDDERWVGQRIELYAEWVRGPKGMCWSVRVRSPQGTGPAAAPQARIMPPASQPTTVTANLESVDTRQGKLDGKIVTVFGINTDQGRFGCLDAALGAKLQALAENKALVELTYQTDPRGRLITAVTDAADAFAGSAAGADDVAF